MIKTRQGGGRGGGNWWLTPIKLEHKKYDHFFKWKGEREKKTGNEISVKNVWWKKQSYLDGCVFNNIGKKKEIKITCPIKTWFDGLFVFDILIIFFTNTVQPNDQSKI